MKSREQIEERLRPLEGVISNRAQTMALAVAMGAQVVENGLGRIGEKDIRIKEADKTIVTPADIESQRIILNILRSGIPNAVISAEEKQNTPLGNVMEAIVNDDTIFVDPLDGSTPFARGIPGSAVTAGDAKACAIAIPSAGFLWVGDKDAGVYRLNLKARRSSDKEKPVKVTVTDGSSKKAYGFVDMTTRETTGPLLGQLFTELPLVTRQNWSIGCSCNVGNTAWVANGSAEFAMLVAKGGFWDMIGYRMINFAGGQSSDQDGNPLTPAAEFALGTCNKKLHDQLLPLVGRIFNGYEGFAPRKRA